MEKILSGKPIAQKIKSDIQMQIAANGLAPKMLLIQIGNDPASAYYVQNIIKNGAKLGCKVEFLELEPNSTQDDLLRHIQTANADPTIDGIMIQKPLPKGFDTSLVDFSIDPNKDVDGIHPLNLGKIMNETDILVPCTAAAVIETLRFYGIQTSGKHVVILGRSTVLGKPLANLLLQKSDFANATVTVCHSKTTDIPRITKTADILVAAIGSARFVSVEMVKENSVLIDVGINLEHDNDGTPVYVGDIDYKQCFDKALAITPVPGGIGTITTSILFQNLLKAALVKRD